jgi:hypothetical protein
MSGVLKISTKSLCLNRTPQKQMCFVPFHTTKLIDLAFFAEKSINGNIYLDMLINWFKPQLFEDSIISSSIRPVYRFDFI